MQKIIKKVTEWHEFQFPDVTEFQIIKKLQEELCELSVELVEGTIDSIAEEMADVCIVSIALGRFRDVKLSGTPLSKHRFNIMKALAACLSETVRSERLEYSIGDLFKASDYYLKERGFGLWDEVEKKLIINRGRDWSKR